MNVDSFKKKQLINYLRKRLFINLKEIINVDEILYTLLFFYIINIGFLVCGDRHSMHYRMDIVLLLTVMFGEECIHIY